MTEIIPIFSKRAHETLKEATERKRKESFALLSAYARLADRYGDFLEGKYGKNSPQTHAYGFAGEESSYRAWICHEWIDMYYRYHAHHTEKDRRFQEDYRQDIHERYEKKLLEITRKLSATGPDIPEAGL